MTRPLLYGHRGASAHELENTMAAFDRARADGADGVELDVHLTADGELAVFHDEDLTRLAGRPDRVADLAWPDLADVRLTGGERVPRLDQVLGETGTLLVNIEIKSPGWRRMRPTVTAVAAAVARTASQRRVLLSSFDVAALALARAATALPCGLLFHARQRRPLRDAWFAPILRPHALHPERVLVDAASMDRWRRTGCDVNVWTADAPDEIRRLAHLGVNAIITNDPAAAAAALA